MVRAKEVERRKEGGEDKEEDQEEKKDEIKTKKEEEGADGGDKVKKTKTAREAIDNQVLRGSPRGPSMSKEACAASCL